MVSNGELPDSQLVSIGNGQYLYTPAGKSWNLMVKAAAKDGIKLASVGGNRRIKTQIELFTARYTPKKISTVDKRWWKGVLYYRKPGMAATAVPGTSNHGWGVANDVANASYGWGKAPSPIVSWLNKNAKKYGWVRPDWTFKEATWEPWHWEYIPELDTTARKLKVDGKLGKATYTEWQEQLGKLTADGVFGEKSVKRLRVRLNHKNGKGGYRLVDGDLKGGATLTSRDIKAVQKLLNVWVARKAISGKKVSLTGKLDHDTVMLLQRSLNARLWD